MWGKPNSKPDQTATRLRAEATGWTEADTPAQTMLAAEDTRPETTLEAGSFNAVSVQPFID